MTTLAFCKPFRVLSQFSPSAGKAGLAEFIETPGVYPAGRLDYDSEGLMLLTDDGPLQHRLSDPRHKLRKIYWVQVEGEISAPALEQLRAGIDLKDGRTRPAQARRIDEPQLWPRDPPIRQRAHIPTSWLELGLREGRNRQVRRMTAALGFPTLRLIRAAIGPIELGDLQPGESRLIDTAVELPALSSTQDPVPGDSPPRRRHRRKSSPRGQS